MKIGFHQFAPVFGDVNRNIDSMAAAVASSGADLLVFPELATSGYLFLSKEEVRAAALLPDDPLFRPLIEACRSAGALAVLGFPELGAADGATGFVPIYNSAALLGPEGCVGVYRKTHLFFNEKDFFEPGDTGYRPIKAPAASLGLCVCYDHMFPEAARTLALRGAQVVCHPSNLVLPEYGQLTTRVRALENRLFWILANRIGTEARGGKSLTYTGRSQIVAPNGVLLAQASEAAEETRVVEIDPALAFDKKVTPKNDLFEDRRPELYAESL